MERASDETLAPLLAQVRVAAQSGAVARLPTAAPGPAAVRVAERVAAWRERLSAVGVHFAEVCAVLSGDSWVPMHAVRGAGATGTRFLQYATEEFTAARPSGTRGICGRDYNDRPTSVIVRAAADAKAHFF